MNVLRQALRTIAKSSLLRVFSLTALSTLIRMITGMVSVKVVSTVIGPSGVALVGQLVNLSTMAVNLGSFGINTAVTKYVAESPNESERLQKLLSTAFWTTLICSAICSLGIITFSGLLGRVIFLSDSYSFVIVTFGFTLLLFSMNGIALAVVNGFQEYRLYTVVNILGSVLGLAFSLTLVVLFGLTGALLGAATFQGLMFFVTVWMLRKKFWFRFQYFTKRIDRRELLRYLKYSVGSLIFLALTPIIQIVLRTYAIDRISGTDAGLWEGMNRVSSVYMAMISTSLAVYYIPRLSGIKNQRDLSIEVQRAFKFVLPLTLVAFGLIYVVREPVIEVLFTPAFRPMEKLFIWQLSLDLLKSCSFVLSYIMLAKAMILEYSIFEILGSFLYILLAFLFLLRSNEVVSIIQGNIVSQALYLIAMVCLFRKILFDRRRIEQTEDER